MKHALANNLKNIPGWRTRRKLVAFAVDDYANVRVASAEARQRLLESGLDLSAPMDRHDALETRADLEALFEVLCSVRDKHGNPAIFTPYALSANPDFERTLAEGESYCYEPVTRTFERLAAEQPQAYEGAWTLWREGMANGLLRPQFHGREHLNVRLFELKLRSGARDLMLNLQNRSVAGIRGEESMPGVGFYQAFASHDGSCIESHKSVLKHGLDMFEEVYGFRSVTFTPPSQVVSPELYPVCREAGIELINKPRLASRQGGDGEKRLEVSWTGKYDKAGHFSLVRNVVFEPAQADARGDLAKVMAQVRTAFRWGKPAIISSHRVNFCGHISEANRSSSLARLRKLLGLIVAEWPQVEFVAVDTLADMISASSRRGSAFD